jgi:hypothetical protein
LLAYSVILEDNLMLFHRYKAKFSSSGYKSYDYMVLRYWFFLGFTLFIPIGKSYGFFYTGLFYWFLETLVIYLATDNKHIRNIIPLIFLSEVIIFSSIYLSEFIWGKNFINDTHQFEPEYEQGFLALAIWHFISYVIFTLTDYFNQKRQATKNNARLL